jgi:hypothetical protein
MHFINRRATTSESALSPPASRSVPSLPPRTPCGATAAQGLHRLGGPRQAVAACSHRVKFTPPARVVSSTTHPTSTGIKFRCTTHATTKKRDRSSLFRDVGAISKPRQEEPMVVWTIFGDQTCAGRLSMARRTLYHGGEKSVREYLR